MATCVVGLLWADASRGDSVTLIADKDNTLYESAAGDLSNGAGSFLFTGRNGLPKGATRRRALLRFPIADSIPAGATIRSADLTLHVSRGQMPVENISLHRLVAEWGEKSSKASGNEGGGAPAVRGDATWIHMFFDVLSWATPGGDFVADASATASVGDLASYTWASTPQLIADVQAMLDSPPENFGWILIADETTSTTAKRVDSRENPDPAARPALVVTYTPATSITGRTWSAIKVLYQ